MADQSPTLEAFEDMHAGPMPLSLDIADADEDAISNDNTRVATASPGQRGFVPRVVSCGEFCSGDDDDGDSGAIVLPPMYHRVTSPPLVYQTPGTHALFDIEHVAGATPLMTGSLGPSVGHHPLYASPTPNNEFGTPAAFVSSGTAPLSDSLASASLGRGRYGAVAQYHSPVLGRSVAVKTMTVFDSSTRAAAASELRFAHRALEHAARCPGTWAHIVRVFEAAHEEADGELSITMELMAGGPVAAHAAFRASASSPRSSCGVSPSTTPQAVGCASPLATTPSASRDPSLPPRRNHTRRQSTVTLPDPGTVPDPATDLSPAERAAREARLRRVAADMLRGVATLHGDLRVIHRDITPANVLLAADGTAKLADFGVAAVLEPDEATATGQHGSLLYMAPERLRGDAYSFASDVWSVGVTLLQLALSGRHPFVDRAAEGASDRFWALAEVLRHTDSPAECARATGAARSAALAAAGLSAEFGSFIEATVAADPADRWSAAALLDRHPWLS